MYYNLEVRFTKTVCMVQRSIIQPTIIPLLLITTMIISNAYVNKRPRENKKNNNMQVQHDFTIFHFNLL